MIDLSKSIFCDEYKAREWLEAQLWPDGPVCPKCSAVGRATLMQGRSHRAGLYQCNACRTPFSVTVGTLYERSHVPLHKWLAATHLIMSTKNRASALVISRTLAVTYKTAWFLRHRIRESVAEALPCILDGEAEKALMAMVERGGRVRRPPARQANSKIPREVLAE